MVEAEEEMGGKTEEKGGDADQATPIVSISFHSSTDRSQADDVVAYPPIIRPIFDWSEVGEHFPQAAPEMDYSLLAQVIAIERRERVKRGESEKEGEKRQHVVFICLCCHIRKVLLIFS